MKILLVDDNESITNPLSKFLSMKGHDCTIVNDGKNALSLCLKQKFDTVILDLAMPRFTGIDFINSLCDEGKMEQQKIIILTASPASDNEIEDLLKKGASVCLRKPVGLDIILQSVIA